MGVWGERLTRVGEGLAVGDEEKNYSRNLRKEPLKEERNNGIRLILLNTKKEANQVN